MYELLLILHSYTRWLVVAAALWVLGRAAAGYFGAKPYTPVDRRAATFFTASMDLQFTLGLILYFVSPVVKMALAAMGTAMKVKDLRYWAVEHITGMVLALVLAHVGSIRVKHAPAHAIKHRLALTWFGMAVLLIILTAPWLSRPWFR